MTPQIIHLRKTSTVLRVSTHIYGVSQEMNGKTFIFRANLSIWHLKWIVSEKWTLFWGFQHRWGVEGSHVDLWLISSTKKYITWYLLYPTDSFLRMSASCWVNLSMWPFKSIALEKWPKTCTLNLQLLHNTKRPRKWSRLMKKIDPPREPLHRHDSMLPSILLVLDTSNTMHIYRRQMPCMRVYYICFLHRSSTIHIYIYIYEADVTFRWSVQIVMFQ